MHKLPVLGNNDVFHHTLIFLTIVHSFVKKNPHGEMSRAAEISATIVVLSFYNNTTKENRFEDAFAVIFCVSEC